MEIFTDEFLKEIGFTLEFRKGTYGKARDKIGMTHLYWNTEGHCCTYFGDKLD